MAMRLADPFKQTVYIWGVKKVTEFLKEECKEKIEYSGEGEKKKEHKIKPELELTDQECEIVAKVVVTKLLS